ncbi:HNH endonuclease family protein [Streptomyces sp. NEAU-Y11]|uniref:HNH endonuclease family protein n=1 Tax=Streptomyces cucumeris TaxID=2962890 RepID=UPI0020C859AE|nr:HNH endonuclease family protein [Streptomyces sp. NEAU-Y11]MCP9213456.1 HNH endonuclease family protein [Streptomyces sp. NEAU-Y11]
MNLKALLVVGAAAAALVLPAVPAAAEPGDTVTTTLTQAIADLPVAAESRDGYERDKFRHWVDADRDGCNTRAEVLLEEATLSPTVGPRCSISGGVWHSYYDDTDQTAARALDIDHMVPLAESWDSGASAWSPAERQAYANDLEDSRALVAVTARENRSKADQDPAEWLPSDGGAVCRYVTEWTAVKTRWELTADPAEVDALERLADGCPDAEITVVLAR